MSARRNQLAQALTVLAGLLIAASLVFGQEPPNNRPPRPPRGDRPDQPPQRERQGTAE